MSLPSVGSRWICASDRLSDLSSVDAYTVTSVIPGPEENWDSGVFLESDSGLSISVANKAWPRDFIEEPLPI